MLELSQTKPTSPSTAAPVVSVVIPQAQTAYTFDCILTLTSMLASLAALDDCSLAVIASCLCTNHINLHRYALDDNFWGTFKLPDSPACGLMSLLATSGSNLMLYGRSFSL